MKQSVTGTRKYISIGVLLFLTTLIFTYLYEQPELLDSLRNITVGNIILLIFTRLGLFTVNGLYLREFSRKFDVDLVFQEWFGLATVTTMGNYVFPFSGGLIARAAYLKKQHKLSYAHFTTLLISNYLVMFWLVGAAGLISLALLKQNWQQYWPIALLFGSVMLGISLVFVFPKTQLPWNNRFTQFFNTLFESWFALKQDYNLLFRLILLTICIILINGISFWLAYKALDLTIPFLTAILLGLVASFSIFINLTPGNLGVQEALVSLSAELLGSSAGEGLLAVLVIRAVTMICAFTLGPFFSYLLTQRTAVS